MKNFKESKLNEKRAELKGLSKPLRKLIDEGQIETINEGLKKIYQSEGHFRLNTLRQWNEMGKIVKKGEKALLLWGQPRKVQKPKEDIAEELDEFDFWPVCYVFSNKQVVDRGAK
ncbi:MAG: hypothetical protein LBQ28_04600 [Prevotellaceae bacterium]|jgi:hypothetical protein|nr:hypothetical protein [Prevotellaceae bacterium]